MRAALALLWIATVAAAFAFGRFAASGGGSSATATVASFQEALAERDELERAERMSAFLQRMGPEDLPAALEALEANNIGVTREEVRLFMLAWSRFDAAGAYAWARAWPGEWSATLLDQAIYAWGFRDPPAALRALELVDDEELQVRLRAALLEGWLHGSDRAGASAYIAGISDPRQRRRLTFQLAGEALRDGPEAVIQWADAVPEDAPNDYKRGAFFLATASVARVDPKRAAAWFEANRTRPYSAGALGAIAQRWAEYHDAPALFEWLRTLPAEGERANEPREAAASGFRAWLRAHPEQAEAWLTGALPDPWLDPALAEFVRSRAQVSPASAVEWAARIEDEGLRRSSLVLAGRVWQRREPDAARAWLASGEVPEDVAEAIRNGPPPVVPRRTAPRRPAAPADR